MFKSTSVPAKVLNVLQSGISITPRQIANKFGVANPHHPVYVLENNGIPVKREYYRIRGIDYVTYSLSQQVS